MRIANSSRRDNSGGRIRAVSIRVKTIRIALGLKNLFLLWLDKRVLVDSKSKRVFKVHNNLRAVHMSTVTKYYVIALYNKKPFQCASYLLTTQASSMWRRLYRLKCFMLLYCTEQSPMKSWKQVPYLVKNNTGPRLLYEDNFSVFARVHEQLTDWFIRILSILCQCLRGIYWPKTVLAARKWHKLKSSFMSC